MSSIPVGANLSVSSEPIVVIGRGRLGTALATSLRAAQHAVEGPLARGKALPPAGAILLCVPDSQIATVSAAIPQDRIVGHCSGALPLNVIEPHDGFSLHPLITVTSATTSFAGVSCAVRANSERTEAVCKHIAETLGMRPFIVSDDMRPLYHAAASLTSGYLIVVADLAARVMARAGVPREHLFPLIRAAIDNWTNSGLAALTGPIARGDEVTVTSQREALARYAPDALAVWDALTAETRDVVGREFRSTGRPAT